MEAYLDQIRAELEAVGVPGQSEVAYGKPAKEIVNWVQENGCDLVAMSTHGHRWLGEAGRFLLVHCIDVPESWLGKSQGGGRSPTSPSAATSVIAGEERGG